MPETMISNRLTFGRAIPSGAMVSDEDWRSFEEGEILSRFPSGYTITRAEGVWCCGADGKPVHEPSIIFDVAHGPDKSEAVKDIAKAYKTRFRQDSVMMTTTVAEVSFV